MRHIQSQSGFAMLFTVLLVSLILSIAIGISNLTLKQAVLSNLAKDSGIAFYQADAAVECGMYQDLVLNGFPKNGALTGTNFPLIFACGDYTMRKTSSPSGTYNIYAIEGADPRKPCFSIIFDKANLDGNSRVLGTGYNVCGASPRQVERTLEVTY